jgi:hypothetical protein
LVSVRTKVMAHGDYIMTGLRDDIKAPLWSTASHPNSNILGPDSRKWWSVAFGALVAHGAGMKHPAPVRRAHSCNLVPNSGGFRLTCQIP